MCPLQWHLKRHWQVDVPESLHSIDQAKNAASWWTDPINFMQVAALLPRDHEVLLFTDASNEGWGCQLGDLHASGLWSKTERRLHINLLELKAVLLSLKHFRDQCSHRASDGSHRQHFRGGVHQQTGGTRSSQMYALLWPGAPKT